MGFHRARDGLSLWMGFFITFASLFYAAFRSDTIAILGKEPKFIANGDVEMDDADNKIVSLLTSKDKEEALVEEEEKENNYDDVDDEENGSTDDEVEYGTDVGDAKA